MPGQSVVKRCHRSPALASPGRDIGTWIQGTRSGCFPLRAVSGESGAVLGSGMLAKTDTPSGLPCRGSLRSGAGTGPKALGHRCYNSGLVNARMRGGRLGAAARRWPLALTALGLACVLGLVPRAARAQAGEGAAGTSGRCEFT